MLELVFLGMLAGLFALVFNLSTVLEMLGQIIGHLAPRRRVHRRIVRAR